MTEVKQRAGRGARDRILAAATELFWANGINATGMDQLAEQAQVSKRTLYAHFASKDELISAYLEHVRDAVPLPTAVLDRVDLPARERLLAIFNGGALIDKVARGCAFLNSAVEVADPDHPAHRFAARYKRDLARRLTEVAREAGAADPKLLGTQLALVWDGAAARAVVLNSRETAAQARAIATILIDNQLGRAAQRGAVVA
jgi:AcrR family transcriptional regulator